MQRMVKRIDIAGTLVQPLGALPADQTANLTKDFVEPFASWMKLIL